MIEYIRIRFGFESFSSNLEYSDSDSTNFEPEYYSNIRIFFLESRIFGFGFENFGDRIIFEYSNLFPWISNIWNIFFLLILNLNWEFLGALPTCLSHLRASTRPVLGCYCHIIPFWAFWIYFLNSCFLLFIFHILLENTWIIRIIFEYSNLFRDSNIFEPFLKFWIIFGFGFENFLIDE